MKKTSLKQSLFVSFVMSLLFTSCVSDDLYKPNGGKSTQEVSHLFNFSTTQKVELNIDYKAQFRVFFQVYDRNPFIIDKNNNPVIDQTIQPLFSAFTSENGIFDQSVTLPAIYNHLFIYSSYIGVEKVLTAKVINGVANAALPLVDEFKFNQAPKTKTNVRTKSLASYQQLGSWTSDGRPNYLAKKSITISNDLLTAINSAFNEAKPVSKSYFKSSNLNVKEDAEIRLNFVDENAGNSNTLFYYCYDTKTEQNLSADEVNERLILAVPNVKRKGFHTWPSTEYYGALNSGEGLDLYYWRPGLTKFSRTFPAGVSVGWVLASNAFSRGDVDTTSPLFYSHPELNPETSGEKNHVALFQKDNFIVIGFEDTDNNSGDGDCNDAVFNVVSNPITAITGDIPPAVIPKDPAAVAYTNVFNGTLAFEDNWPRKGDYDMNDVMVKYHSVVSYNYLNEVISCVDEFKLLWSGANFENGFAYQMNVPTSNVTVEVKQGDFEIGNVRLEPKYSKATIFLANNLRKATSLNTTTPTYVVKTSFKKRIPYYDFVSAPYNPFIMVQNKVEVHLPGYAPAGVYDNKALFGTADDVSDLSKGQCYLSAGFYPFALNIVGDDVMIMNDSKYESKSIEQFYPEFKGWANSQGVSNKDWYKHPAK